MVVTLDAEENINLKLDIGITWHFVLGEKEESTTWKPFLTNPSNISVVHKTIIISILQGGKLKYRNTNSLESGLKTDFESENRTFLRDRNRDPSRAPPVPKAQFPPGRIWEALLPRVLTPRSTHRLHDPLPTSCAGHRAPSQYPHLPTLGAPFMTNTRKSSSVSCTRLSTAPSCVFGTRFVFPEVICPHPLLPTLKSQSYKRVKSRIYTPCWRTEPCTSGIQPRLHLTSWVILGKF